MFSRSFFHLQLAVFVHSFFFLLSLSKSISSIYIYTHTHLLLLSIFLFYNVHTSHPCQTHYIKVFKNFFHVFKLKFCVILHNVITIYTTILYYTFIILKLGYKLPKKCPLFKAFQIKRFFSHNKVMKMSPTLPEKIICYLEIPLEEVSLCIRD